MRRSIASVVPGYRAAVQKAGIDAWLSVLPGSTSAEYSDARRFSLQLSLVARSAARKCLWLALRAAVLRLAISSLSASPLPPPTRSGSTGGRQPATPLRPGSQSLASVSRNRHSHGHNWHSCDPANHWFPHLHPSRVFKTNLSSTPNPSLKRSANGMSHWPSSAGPTAHFALAVQPAMPSVPA